MLAALGALLRPTGGADNGKGIMNGRRWQIRRPFLFQRRKLMAFEDGPYLQVACFCEKVLREGDGVASLIRVIDTITHTAAGNPPPDQMPAVVFPMQLVLMFKPGNARGRSELRIVGETPSGIKEEPVIAHIHFEGEDKGQNIISDFQYAFNQEGLYWFHIYIDGEKVTSMPIRIKYNPVFIRQK